MKVPAAWSDSNVRIPSAWGVIQKTARQWSGSSIVRTTAQASSWTHGTKANTAWDAGAYAYDSFLAYDSPVSYDGSPKPITTKVPSQWSKQ